MTALQQPVLPVASWGHTYNTHAGMIADEPKTKSHKEISSCWAIGKAVLGYRLDLPALQGECFHLWVQRIRLISPQVHATLSPQEPVCGFIIIFNVIRVMFFKDMHHARGSSSEPAVGDPFRPPRAVSWFPFVPCLMVAKRARCASYRLNRRQVGSSGKPVHVAGQPSAEPRPPCATAALLHPLDHSSLYLPLPASGIPAPTVTVTIPGPSWKWNLHTVHLSSRAWLPSLSPVSPRCIRIVTWARMSLPFKAGQHARVCVDRIVCTCHPLMTTAVNNAAVSTGVPICPFLCEVVGTRFDSILS